MKKLFSIILCGILVFGLLPLTSCKKEDTLVLNVYNWEEYIACEDYDMIAEFEKWYPTTHNGQKVRVNYSTFGTNENMYNELKLTQNKKGDEITYSYDLVCPSEYMIQKMIIEGMCEEFDHSKMVNYNKNLSPYIKNLFGDSEFYKYATFYNWGTMGFTYNPQKVEYNHVSSWSVVTNPNYQYKFSIKDSVRDSYVLALGYINREELLALDVTSDTYNQEVGRLLNDFSDETIEKARVFLSDVRKNLYGFEVDSGKQDMATGKLWINFAWSGDAVYAMDIAEEEGTYLEYVVPNEGSNLFFDGWVMPKGANTELAQEFLEFMYDEERAIENLDYICYSSPMVGESIFEYVCDNYGLTTLIPSESATDYKDSNGKFYEEVYVGNAPNFETNLVVKDGLSTYRVAYLDDNGNIAYEETPIYAHSVKLFFGDKIEGDGIIYTDSLNRQLVAMYPTAETLNRCVIMEHADSETLKKLNNMWDSVKVGYMPYSTMIIIVVAILLVLALFITFTVLRKKGITIKPTKKFDGKLVKSERIK